MTMRNRLAHILLYMLVNKVNNNEYVRVHVNSVSGSFPFLPPGCLYHAACLVYIQSHV